MRPWAPSQLALTKGERVVRIRSCAPGRWYSPSPSMRPFLPLEIGKKIITNNLKVEPIFSLLERKYDVPLIEAEYKLDAVEAQPEVAAALKVKRRRPDLFVSNELPTRRAAVQSITKGCTTEAISSASRHAWFGGFLVEPASGGISQ